VSKDWNVAQGNDSNDVSRRAWLLRWWLGRNIIAKENTDPGGLEPVDWEVKSSKQRFRDETRNESGVDGENGAIFWVETSEPEC